MNEGRVSDVGMGGRGGVRVEMRRAKGMRSGPLTPISFLSSVHILSHFFGSLFSSLHTPSVRLSSGSVPFGSLHHPRDDRRERVSVASGPDGWRRGGGRKEGTPESQTKDGKVGSERGNGSGMSRVPRHSHVVPLRGRRSRGRWPTT